MNMAVISLIQRFNSHLKESLNSTGMTQWNNSLNNQSHIETRQGILSVVKINQCCGHKVAARQSQFQGMSYLFHPELKLPTNKLVKMKLSMRTLC